MIAAIILPIANLLQIQTRVVVRTLKLAMLQITSSETILLIRSIPTIIDSVAHPIVALDAVLVLAQKPLALALDVRAADRLVRSIEAMGHTVAHQIQRDAHFVRAGELELAARDRDVRHFVVVAVFLVVSAGAVVVLVAQERRTDAAVVVLAAVPHWFLAEKVITPNLVAPVGAVLDAVAVIYVRNTSPIIAAVFVFTACRCFSHTTARGLTARGFHASNVDNDANDDQQHYDRIGS